jgi:hypothetical protein
VADDVLAGEALGPFAVGPINRPAKQDVGHAVDKARRTGNGEQTMRDQCLWVTSH